VSSRPVFVRAPSGGGQCQYDELRRCVGGDRQASFHQPESRAEAEV